MISASPVVHIWFESLPQAREKNIPQLTTDTVLECGGYGGSEGIGWGRATFVWIRTAGCFFVQGLREG